MNTVKVGHGGEAKKRRLGTLGSGTKDAELIDQKKKNFFFLSMGTSIDFFSPSSLLHPPGLLRPPESTPHAPLAGDRHYPHFSLLSRRIKLSDVTGGRFDVQASLTEADFFFWPESTTLMRSRPFATSQVCILQAQHGMKGPWHPMQSWGKPRSKRSRIRGSRQFRGSGDLSRAG